jgi:tRNA pseudouridine32 synthase/23S rRNA pseudouridine746 synthase
VIVHIDDAWVVADKPAGLPSVPGRPQHLRDCLWRQVQDRVPDALVVHRLDMATSGLMVFARGAMAQRRLSAAFAARQVDKRYIAWVDGLMQRDEGAIDLPLNADWPNRPRQIVDLEHGKPSLTHFAVQGRDARTLTTRVELAPKTGRSHQLRVHLAALGHPILGDTLYAPVQAASHPQRLMLHATALAFADPCSGAPVRFDSPAPF